MKASVPFGLLAAAALSLASCHINNGKLDMSWVSDRMETPVNDEVELEGARSTGPTVAVTAPPAGPVAPAAAAAPTAPAAPVAAPTAATAPAPAAKAGTYTVKSGDTLGGIAARHHSSTAAIVSANHIANPDALKVGQVLRIPAASAVKKPAAKKATVPASRYTVKSGDTLSAISRRTGVPVQQLMRANNMSSSSLKAGAKLTIPKH
ncbi:MAG: LysM peptidoglycan-binding domain-containing protein [Akkermansia sp.]|nr:LysM peptidoglycan-binding domain-containing protein [Akkermansia sp.]